MAFNLGAFAGGMARGLESGQAMAERKQQMEDRKLLIQQHQRALDDAKLDDAAEAALANYYSQGPQGGVSSLPGGMPPPPGVPPVAGPAPQTPPQQMGGIPGPQIGAPPPGPQPPMPGQASAPAQPQANVAPPQPNPYAAPAGPSATSAPPGPSAPPIQNGNGAGDLGAKPPDKSPVDLSLLDQSRLVMETAKGIKAKNPGIDDRTLLHALAKAGEIEGKFGTEGKAIVNAQIQIDRINSQNQRQEADIQSKANLAIQKAQSDQERDALKSQAMIDLANLKAEHAKQLADIRAEFASALQGQKDRAAGGRQEATLADKKQARQDTLQRATMVRDKISSDLAAGRGDKRQLAARAEMSKSIIAQMNGAQRIMNAALTPGGAGEDSATYKTAERAYDAATTKLEALEKAAGTEATGQPAAAQPAKGAAPAAKGDEGEPPYPAKDQPDGATATSPSGVKWVVQGGKWVKTQ